jgi:hypothetical protein
MKKCLNCQREIEKYRADILNSSLCANCIRKVNFVLDHVPFKPSATKSQERVKNSKLMVSFIKDTDPLTISLPFKRVNKPTMEIIRDGHHRPEKVFTSCLINRVVDNNVARTDNLRDASSEFYTSVPRSANGDS